MKYYYKLDQGTTGKPLARFRLDQGDPTLVYLDEAPDNLSSWNGTAWVSNADLVSKDYERQVANTDKDHIRIIDDLINVLITKGTITWADLDAIDPQIKIKYDNRVTLRGNI